MTTPLSEFRDIVTLLFRVVNHDSYRSGELTHLLNKIHDILARNEPQSSKAMFDPVVFRELVRPPTPPTLVIHPDQDAGEIVPNVVVTKEEPEIHEVRNLIVNLPAVVHAVKGPEMDAAILKNLARDIGSDDDEEEEDDDIPDIIDDESELMTDDDADAETTPLDDDQSTDGEVEEDEEAAEEEEAAASAAAAAAAEKAEEMAAAAAKKEAAAKKKAEEEAAAKKKAEEEAAEEAEEVEEEEEEVEEEEEAEEDDDLQLKKIGKHRYYWSPSSNRVYEYLEEGYGDCVGTYEGGKIVPK